MFGNRWTPNLLSMLYNTDLIIKHHWQNTKAVFHLDKLEATRTLAANEGSAFHMSYDLRNILNRGANPVIYSWPIVRKSVNVSCPWAIVLGIKRANFLISLVGEPIDLKRPEFALDIFERFFVYTPTIRVFDLAVIIGGSVQVSRYPSCN